MCRSREQAAVRGLPVTDAAYESVNVCYERCLFHLHKMPKLWQMYCVFLSSQHLLTRTRQAFDRALASLPITQHSRWVWPEYLRHVLSCGVNATIARVYRRYLKLEPAAKETWLDWLRQAEQWDDAALLLIECIDDERFVSVKGKSRHELWSELLQILVRHARSTPSVDSEAVIRSGIARFPNESGRLYCALASFFIRCGLFTRARDVYEEAVAAVGTVRDFTQVFDAYSKYEETMLTMSMRDLDGRQTQRDSKDNARQSRTETQTEEAEDDDDDEDEEEEEEEEEEGEEDAAMAIETDIELSILRLEDLLNRRPLLLSSVLLRQNPHNVDEWLRRTELFPDEPTRVIQTFTEAVSSIDPAQASGEKSLAQLWSAFARFYLQHEDEESALLVYEKAVAVPFRSMEQLVGLYCEWVELELKAGRLQRARDILASVCRLQPRRRQLRDGKEEEQSVQQRVHRSTRLWSLYADLEENIGTLTTTRAVYDAMLELRVITPQLLLNYCELLTEHGYHEEAFRVYERGCAAFHHPHSTLLWLHYLHHFITRYGGSKRERVRDLFEQALAAIPADHARKVYLLYAKYEEDHGLARRAMDVYGRAAQALPLSDRYALYLIYIARVTARFGLSKAREVYEQAMRALPDRHVLPLCLSYAKLELRLGEVDRARALYQYVSQWADAREERGSRVWKEWEAFEVEHGNEETYREMLRVKRSVAAAHASVGRRAAAGDEQDEDAAVSSVLKKGLIDTGGQKKRKRGKDRAQPAAERETEAGEEEAGQSEEEEEGGGGRRGQAR